MSEILNINGQPAEGSVGEILKPNGQPVHPPEPELDNLTKAIISLYGALTPDQQAILSVGVPMVCVLKQTLGTDGLGIRIHPAQNCRVDHENKKVIFLKEDNAKNEIAEASPVSLKQGIPADPGTENETPKGVDFGGGADAAQ